MFVSWVLTVQRYVCVFLYVFCKILLTYIYNLLRENPVESAPQLAEKNKALGHDDICSEH